MVYKCYVLLPKQSFQPFISAHLQRKAFPPPMQFCYRDFRIQIVGYFLVLIVTSDNFNLFFITGFINKYVHDYSIVDRLLVYIYF
jgi:hypothetical protein